MSDQLLALQADGQLLLAALRRYLSTVKPAEQQKPPSHLRPWYNDGMEPSGPKKETFKSRPVMTAKTQAGSIQGPLTSVDGGFIHSSTFGCRSSSSDLCDQTGESSFGFMKQSSCI